MTTDAPSSTRTPARSVLVTGASTGIGLATAAHLAATGWRVFAGVRREADARTLAALPGHGGGRVEPVMLDVTDEASVLRAVAQTDVAVGSAGLTALVNNAGIVVPGPVEHVVLDEWRRQFEVNLFGAVSVTRACLPLLRRSALLLAGTRDAARIVMVSSVGGRIAQPINAPYVCSKFALKALGHSLRVELRSQGIGVSVVEPGAIATPIWAKAEGVSAEFSRPDHPARAVYGREIDAIVAMVEKSSRDAIAPEVVARRVACCLTARRAPMQALVGRDARVMGTLRKLLPAPAFEAILLRVLGLNRPPRRVVPSHN